MNISASLCSYQSRSQSVAWSHDTSSRNKIRQRSSFEVGRHMWCQSWALLGGTTNSISAIPLLPPSSSARVGARSEGVCIKLLTLPGQGGGRWCGTLYAAFRSAAALTMRHDLSGSLDNEIRPTSSSRPIEDIRLIVLSDCRELRGTPSRPAVFAQERSKVFPCFPFAPGVP